MNINIPGGGFNSSRGTENKDTERVAHVKPSTEAEIQSTSDLKQAQQEGKIISISEEQLVKAIDRAIKAVEGTSTTLDFSIHEETKHIIVKVLNKESGEVIREILSER